MLTTILSLIITPAAAVSVSNSSVPAFEELKSVSEARFRSPIRSTEITSRKAEKLTVRNGCTSMKPTPTWEGMKVVVLMLVDNNGSVKQITPVDMGCPAVEKYGAEHIAKHIDKLVSKPRGDEPKWYRTSIIYSW